ncbi:MAG: stage III sporulation protein AG [Eubacteriales bacterium]|nr:stage III sporulation protein AG [Eubacteriales bacterium]
MTGKEWYGKLRKKYWPPGKEQLLILVLTGLLLAVIALPAERKEETEQEISEDQEAGEPAGEADYGTRMERRLEELLASVEGVGEVRVMLTFEGTGEEQVEKDKSRSSDGTQEETVYEETDGDRTPYISSRTNPKVTGVLVIAQGGGSTSVQSDILEAAQALFGIEPHKIKIMKMGNSSAGRE